MTSKRKCNGYYVFYLKEIFDLLMQDLAQYIGVMLVGDVVDKFKYHVSVAGLCYMDGIKHQVAARYVSAYLGKEQADLFIDQWSTYFANTFIGTMVYLPGHTEEFDIRLQDDILEVRVFDKPPTLPQTNPYLQQLELADENQDYIPESVRNAIRRL